jgi:hypothetical protein
MDRAEKVKTVIDIAKRMGTDMSVVMFILALATDKSLTKIVKDFQEMVAQVK